MSVIKLNLGCGKRKMAGYVNVDKSTSVAPDLLLDLEALPWPFETDTVSEIQALHVLEHVGRDTDNFLGIMKECIGCAATTRWSRLWCRTTAANRLRVTRPMFGRSRPRACRSSPKTIAELSRRIIGRTRHSPNISTSTLPSPRSPMI